MASCLSAAGRCEAKKSFCSLDACGQPENRHLLPAFKVVQRMAQEESNNNLFVSVSVVLSSRDSRKPFLKRPLHFSAFDRMPQIPYTQRCESIAAKWVLCPVSDVCQDKSPVR